MDGWPDVVTANAWTGDGPASGTLADRARAWTARDRFASRRRTKADAPPEPELSDWAHPDVGWGLLLPDGPGRTREERARLSRPDDAPAPVQELAAFRSANRPVTVLRHHPDDPANLFHYTTTGRRLPVPMTGDGPRGAGSGRLPRYLLIAAEPERIPWDVQFALNPVCFTGRLDLDDSGLRNYVNAVVSDWAGSALDATRPLLWTVQHERDDITWLMRQSVGERVLARWQSDSKVGDRAVALRAEHAVCPALVAGLAAHRPGVVVTTSHGMTGPLHDPDRMRATLGGLVDAGHAVLDPDRLMSAWQPDGAVWYALACCSAGGSGRNQFAGLLDPDGSAGRVMRAVADLGPTTAILPRRLLGTPRPARAFIGHVEPTLDWTLRRADSGLVTTETMVRALYDKFFQAQPMPVGLALREWFLGALALRSRWVEERGEAAQAADLPSAALLATLAGIDRQCTVILGDPAVAPAPLPAGT